MEKTISNRFIMYIVVSIIVVLTLSMTYLKGNNYKISEDKEYTKLFHDALTSDGAYAEGFYSDLSYHFLEGPEHFIEQCSLLKEDKRDIILFNVAYIMCINEHELNNKFKNVLYKIEYRNNSLEFNTTLDHLIEKYESITMDMTT